MSPAQRAALPETIVLYKLHPKQHGRPVHAALCGTHLWPCICGHASAQRTPPIADPPAVSADSTLVNLGGSQASLCAECSAAVTVRATTVALQSCTFAAPFVALRSRYILATESARVKVSNCTFGPAIQPFEARAGSTLYSDNSSSTVVGRNSRTQPPTTLSDIPAQQPGEPPLFLSADDAWFAQLRYVRPSPPLQL